MHSPLKVLIPGGRTAAMLAVAVLSIPFSIRPVSTQQPALPEQLVVSLRIVDKKGTPQTDFAPIEFEVKENGQSRTIMAFVDGHLETDDALVRDVDNMLGIVKKRHRVVIASEEQDFAVQPDESLERRVVAKRVVPGLRRDQMIGVLSPYDESGDVGVDLRAGKRAEKLDQRAVVALRSGSLRIECRKLLEDLALISLTEMAATNVVVIVGATRVHHQRPVTRHRILQREMNLIGTACNRADR